MFEKSKSDLWVEMSIREISTQSLFAQMAYNNLRSEKITTDVVFFSIHSFLSHTAIISKLLKAKNAFGNNETMIGTILQHPIDSVVHKRTFRNHLDHYDERLREWIKKYGATVNIGTYNIGPKSMVQAIAGMTDFVYISHYDPATGVVTFVDDDFNLNLLSAEVSKIKILADTWVEKMMKGIIRTPYDKGC